MPCLGGTGEFRPGIHRRHEVTRKDKGLNPVNSVFRVDNRRTVRVELRELDDPASSSRRNESLVVRGDTIDLAVVIVPDKIEVYFRHGLMLGEMDGGWSFQYHVIEYRLELSESNKKVGWPSRLFSVPLKFVRCFLWRSSSSPSILPISTNVPVLFLPRTLGLKLTVSEES